MLEIGHRGGSGDLPENTISAFVNSIKKGLKCIEFDVHLTKDEHLVLHHDYNTIRQTGVDALVNELTLAELKEMDFANYLKNHHKIEPIVTLDELFELMPMDMILNVEIKNISRHKTAIAKKVVECIHRHHRVDTVIVSAFDHFVLKQVAELDKNIKIGLLLYSYLLNPLTYIQSLDFNVYSVHPAIELVDDLFIKEVKSGGYKVYAYTINTVEEYTYLKNQHVTGLFTDFPGTFDVK